MTNKAAKIERLVATVIVAFIGIILIGAVFVGVSVTKHRAGIYKDTYSIDIKLYSYASEHIVKANNGELYDVRYVYITDKPKLTEIPEKNVLEDIQSRLVDSNGNRRTRILNVKQNGEFLGQPLEKDKFVARAQTAKTFGAKKFKQTYKFDMDSINSKYLDLFPQTEYKMIHTGYFFLENTAAISLKENSNLIRDRRLSKSFQAVSLNNNPNLAITIIQRNHITIYATVFIIFMIAFLIYVLVMLIFKMNESKKNSSNVAEECLDF